MPTIERLVMVAAGAAVALLVTWFCVGCVLGPISHPPGLGLRDAWVFCAVPVSAAGFARLIRPSAAVLFIYGLIESGYLLRLFFSDRDFRFALTLLGLNDFAINTLMLVLLVALGAACSGVGAAIGWARVPGRDRSPKC